MELKIIYVASNTDPLSFWGGLDNLLFVRQILSKIGIKLRLGVLLNAGPWQVLS